MVDIKELIKNKDKYLKSFSAKNMNLDAEVNGTTVLYEFYLKLINEEQTLREELNDITNKIKKELKNEELKLKVNKQTPYILFIITRDVIF